MIRVGLDADAVARTRFAISPLTQLNSLLFTLGRRPQDVPIAWRERAVGAIRERRLHLLAALAFGARGNLPDFLAPVPDEFRSSLDTGLHKVATTPAKRIHEEIEAVLNGLNEARLSISDRAQRIVREALQRGEEHLAEQLVSEFDQLWTHAFEEHWPALRRRLEYDIVRRAEASSAYGLVGMLETLSDKVTWHDGRLLVAIHPIAADAHAAVDVDQPGLVLAPVVFARAVVMIIDCQGDDAVRPIPTLWYPARPYDEPLAGPQPELLGVTRAAVLAELTHPATTGELAGRLHLTQGAVSYHLQILHRAGLIDRTRQSRRVFYQARRPLPVLDR